MYRIKDRVDDKTMSQLLENISKKRTGDRSLQEYFRGSGHQGGIVLQVT